MQLNTGYLHSVREITKGGHVFHIKNDEIVCVTDLDGNVIALHRVPFQTRSLVEAELDPHAATS